MEQAFNTNTAAFSAGIQFLEAENAVLKRVLQDVHEGTPMIVGAEPHGKRALVDRIDFGGYLRGYIAELAEQEEREEKAKEPPLLVDSQADQPIVFGGH
jgi:hypothetical protein